MHVAICKKAAKYENLNCKNFGTGELLKVSIVIKNQDKTNSKKKNWISNKITNLIQLIKNTVWYNSKYHKVNWPKRLPLSKYILIRLSQMLTLRDNTADRLASYMSLLKVNTTLNKVVMTLFNN